MVFVTKYRYPVFTAAYLDRVQEIMRDVCGTLAGRWPSSMGESNHST